MRFGEGDFNRVRRAFLGPNSDAFAEFLHKRSFGALVDDFSDELPELARSLGFLDARGDLTEVGQCVASSCREYIFWRERDRKLPFESDAEWLNPSYFAGRKVVEIGCGMGVNLMSLEGVADCVGIEPFEIYKQMGSILRERDGLVEPEILIADGENVPLPDNSADVVLCVTAHQYFDVVAVLAEVSRILKPEGELFIIGWTLPEYLSSLKKPRLTNSDLKKAIITLANTASYSFIGKRVFPAHPDRNTSRPIYPSAARLRIWMEAADIRADPKRVHLGGDCFQRGRKRLVSGAPGRVSPKLSKDTS